MGKFASFIRNLILIVIAFLLSHLGYRLYILTIKMTEMIIKLEETNGNIKLILDILKEFPKKISLF